MNGVAFCLVGIPPYSEHQGNGRRDGLPSTSDNPRPAMATCPGRDGGGGGGGGGGMAWHGPRTLLLRKTSQGFGFTLRHFIVYPPESALQTSLKDEENGNGKGYQRSRLEPMDTIFVKNVRERGPAHQAGLCAGDRLVKVNGESILGRTYSQVIALIQNSESVLELSIMPKDQDVLQLAYSQDAYLRGNEPYSGEAQNLPTPPPTSYPRRSQALSGGLSPSLGPMGQNQLDNWSRWPGSSGPSSPLDNRSAAVSPAGWQDGRAGELGGVGHSSPAHRTEEIQYGMTGQQAQGQYRGRSYSSSSSSGGLLASPLQVHYPGHAGPGASSAQAPPWRSKQSWVSPPQPKPPPPPRQEQQQQQQQQQHPGRSRGERCQQALSDWYHSQVPERTGRRMQTRHRSYSQDRLGETRSRRLQQQQQQQQQQQHQPRTGAWPHSASQDTLMLLQQSGPGPHGDPYWTYEDWEGAPGRAQRVSNYARTRSEDLLAQYDRSYGRSLEMLEQTGTAALVSPRMERPAAPPWSQGPPAPPPRTEAPQRQGPQMARHSQAHQKHQTQTQNQAQAQAHPQTQQAAPQSRRLATAQSADDQAVGYRSYSPSFYRKTGRILQQAHSFRDPSYAGPHLNWNPTPNTSPPEGAPAASVTSPPRSTTPDLTDRAYRPTNHERDRASGSGSGSGSGSASEERRAEAPAQTQEVVLRQKPPTGRRNAYGMRHPHYALPLDSLDPGLFSPEGDDSAFHTPPAQPPRGEDGPRKANGAPAPLSIEEDSLASIPFIDEPTSPSVDLCARHVPASSVVSGGLSSAPAAITSPAPPAFTFPHDRLFSHDCSSIKSSRRSSYLLAITTERSKSCDEGLNSFREEGRVFSRLPKRVKSFFTDGSLDNLGAAEEARKRHSTSELGTVLYSDVRREGWLHYKQILTEKGKKVGGGMRPWRRVFSVMRSHSLFLYKDKREAVLRGATVPGGAEDEQPISIRGCLVDIAYSETKRKHALRLTTQDFCEYLLQADDREDMLAWIKVIRENGKTDNEEFGFSRQALISKKLNDYRKQSPTGSKPDSSPKATRLKPPFLSKMENAAGAPRSPKTEGKEESSPPKSPWGINIIKKSKKSGPKAFGVRLEDCQPGANNKFIPLIVEICCGLVEEMGLEYTGIYRVPGNNAMVSTLQDQLNKGLDINPTEEKWQDLNVVSSLLKSFFRKLPEPVFTDDKYNDFIDANRLDSNSERLKTMNKLIRDLPDHYYHTLKFLIGHLKTVADHSDKNKMEPRNLALVFGPTLVRTSEDNMTDMVTHMPDRYKIVETLIQHYIWFFTDEMDMDEKQTPVETGDVQPAPNIDHLLSNIGRTAYLGEASDSTNSEGAKSKMSWGSKKDLTAKDFLTLSIMSAVTGRKRRKRNGRRGASSTDDDSEQEPIKPSQVESEEGEVESPTGDTAPRAVGEEDDEEEEEEEEEEEDEARREAFQTSAQVKEESGEVGVAEAAGQTLATQVNEEPSQVAAMPREEEEEEVEKERAGVKGSPWRSPEDARSIVSGYSTLSTLGRSLMSHGDDADDENSELVSETDNESGFASRSVTQERPEKHPAPAVPPAEAQPTAEPAAAAATTASQRSFLYTHYKSPTPVLSPTPLLAQHAPEPTERSEGGARSTTPSSSSSSAAAHRLHSRPSFNSHKLIQCDTLARKKAKARSMDLLDSLGPDRTEGGPRLRRDPSRTNPSSGSSQESLRPAPSQLASPPGEAASFAPSGGPAQGRGSLVDQVRARLLGSADDLHIVGLRKPLSPETRRKRRAWRRHTVVASPTETTGKRPLLLTGHLPLSPMASGQAKPAAPPAQRLDPEPVAGEELPASRRAPPSRFHQYL